MDRQIGLLVVAMLLVACGGPAPSSAPSSDEAATPAIASPTGTAPQPTGAPAPTPASGGTAGQGYLVCPTLDGDLCPVPPGPYQVDIHDAFSLTVPEAGWVELPTAPEEEPTLVLARADAPDQRVIIDSGPTGGILDDAGLLHLVDLPVAAGSSAPIQVSVGGASGYQVEISKDYPGTITSAGTIGLGRAGAVDLEPGSAYRIAALQVPYGQESALKTIVIAAPSGDFEAFATLADGLLETVRFVE
jgi:hypothetical protein